MITKMFEIRDAGTFIPVVCIEMRSDIAKEAYLLGRDGFDMRDPLIQMVWTSCNRTEYDPFKWGGRTMPTAHRYIVENWSELETGDVIDVEFILGEKENKKVSESEVDYGF